MTLRRLASAAVGLVVTASAHPASASPGVVAASYFGAEGADAITGVALASDGSIVLAGTTTSASLGGVTGKMLGAGTGYVAKLDRRGTHLLWLARLGATGKVHLTAGDAPIVATGSTLTKLAADGTSIAWTTADLGAPVTAFDVAPSGNVAALAGRTLRVFAPDGATSVFSVADIGRSNPTGVAIDPKSGDVFVSGDDNAGNCSGPWRSPFIFRYGAAGTKTWSFYDYPGAVACGQYQLQADSFFTNLRFEPDGTLWTDGGADGGNTVLGQAALDLSKSNPALAGACYPSACYGWKGAAKVGFAARLNPALTDFDRATFVVAHYAHAPAGCSCDTTDPGVSARANSAGLQMFATSTGDVVGVGSSSWHFPTVDAWYPHAAYSPGYPSVVSLLDHDLETMKMATILPGTGSMLAADYRAGRVVVVGSAPDNGSWMAPSDQTDLAQATVPATPAAAPLQSGYGGGVSDGFLYVACVTTDAECNASGSASADGGAPGVPGVPGVDGGEAAGKDAGARAQGAGPSSSGPGCGCHVSRSRWLDDPALVGLLGLSLVLGARRRARARRG